MDTEKNVKGNIGLLIFDLDGTLADTMYGIMDGVNMAMDKFGAPHHTYEEVCSYVGNGSMDLIRRSLPEHMAKDEVILEEAVRYYDSSCYPVTYGNGTECYEGMTEALDVLKSRGYTLAILSNKRDIFVKPMAKELFREGLFSYVLGQRDDLPKKPDPTMALTIAAELGFGPDEAAFIGDGDTDMKTAKNAKMTAVGCAWGYRGEKVLKASGADVIIRKPCELTDLF